MSETSQEKGNYEQGLKGTLIYWRAVPLSILLFRYYYCIPIAILLKFPSRSLPHIFIYLVPKHRSFVQLNSLPPISNFADTSSQGEDDYWFRSPNVWLDGFISNVFEGVLGRGPIGCLVGLNLVGKEESVNEIRFKFLKYTNSMCLNGNVINN